MESLLRRWLGVRPSEQRRTLLLFCSLLLLTLFIILGRNARDTLFLSRSNIQALPWMYVGVAVCSGLVALLYGRVLARVSSLHAMIQGTLLGVAAFVAVARMLIIFQWPWVYALFYVGMEAAGTLLVLQFWTFVGESFNARQARRLFGLIGSGGVLGAVLGGFGGGLLATRLGVPNLLLVGLAALAGAGLTVFQVHREAGADEDAPRRPHRRRVEGARGVLEALISSRYTAMLAAMMAVLTVAVSLVDFSFKLHARALYGETELAQLFGLLYGVCGVFSFFLHFFLTGRLLARVGLAVSLLVLPLSLLISAGLLVLNPTFGPLLVAKGVDTTLRYSAFDAALQLLYIPLVVQHRRRVKAGIDAVVKPMSVALVGVLLLVMGAPPLMELGVILAGLLVGWLLLALAVQGGYARALIDRLGGAERLDQEDLSLDDAASVRALEEALRHEDENIVCHAMDLLPPGDPGRWQQQLLPLLTSPSEKIRIRALRLSVRDGIDVPWPKVERLLVDRSETLRAEAVGYVGRRNRDGAAERLIRALDDRSDPVRAMAAVQLALRSGQEQAAGVDALQGMAESPFAGARQWAAWGMGQCGRALPPLAQLLQDPSVEVQRAAVEATLRLTPPDFVPALMALLDSPVGFEAAGALAAYGPGLVPSLVEEVVGGHESPLRRFHLLRALRTLAHPSIPAELVRQLPDDPEVRLDMLKAAWAVGRAVGGGVDKQVVRPALQKEVVTCYQTWATMVDLGTAPVLMLVREALLEEQVRSQQRLLLLLALAYPAPSMMSLVRAVEGGQPLTSAWSIEVLDGLLDWEERAWVLPLLEEMTPEERLERVAGLLQPLRATPEEWLFKLLGHSDRWVRVTAFNAIGVLRLSRLAAEVDKRLRAEVDPVVRETAAVTLSRLMPPSEVLAMWRRLADDPAREVRRMAAEQLAGRT